jgi:hypothetical protein
MPLRAQSLPSSLPLIWTTLFHFNPRRATQRVASRRLATQRNEL